VHVARVGSSRGIEHIKSRTTLYIKATPCGKAVGAPSAPSLTSPVGTAVRAGVRCLTHAGPGTGGRIVDRSLFTPWMPGRGPLSPAQGNGASSGESVDAPMARRPGLWRIACPAPFGPLGAWRLSSTFLSESRWRGVTIVLGRPSAVAFPKESNEPSSFPSRPGTPVRGA
jgi:hypothetical protein